MTSPADAVCACTALRKATRAVSRLYDEALAEAGINSTQFAILRHVQRAQPAPLSRLAEALVMDRTSLYRALQPMQRQGWVELLSGAGRARQVRLTPAGEGKAAEALPGWSRAQARFLEQFGGGDWTPVSDGLARVVEVLRD